MSDHRHPSVRRVLDEHGGEVFDVLTSLSGADFASLMLAVSEHRVRGRSAADILAQYRRDRFVGPAPIPARALRRVAEVASRVAGGFDEVQLAPVAPLGLHAVLGGISQNRVVTTTRATEVAADPTNALALEAAERRRAGGDDVRLCAVQRITRAQLDHGPLTYAHFTLFGLVTAGRDDGNHRFERTNLAAHITLQCALVDEVGLGPARVALSDLDGHRQQPLDWLAKHLGENGIDAAPWNEREAGTGYYPSLCFKVFARTPDGEEIEVGDGGVVPWTQALLQNRKERLVISGVGLDRLAACSPLIPRDRQD